MSVTTVPGAPRESKIEELLNAAIDATVKSFEGLPANPQNLDHMGKYARDIVLTQAECGMWREWSITTARELEPLVCTFEVRQHDLIGNSRIAPKWDFSRTPLCFLATWEG